MFYNGTLIETCQKHNRNYWQVIQRSKTVQRGEGEDEDDSPSAFA